MSQCRPLQLFIRSSKGELLESLTSILTVDEMTTDDLDAFNNKAVVAYVVPTFQAPAPSQVFHGHSNPIPSDVSLVQNPMKVVRMASAFHVLLTAGSTDGPMQHDLLERAFASSRPLNKHA